MANRQQRRAGKKMLNKPELKKYVDQFCMEMSSMLVDSCEVAKNESEKSGKPIDFASIQSKLEVAMNKKGEELGMKVKEIVRESTGPQIKTNIRARSK